MKVTINVFITKKRQRTIDNCFPRLDKAAVTSELKRYTAISGTQRFIQQISCLTQLSPKRTGGEIDRRALYFKVSPFVPVRNTQNTPKIRKEYSRVYPFFQTKVKQCAFKRKRRQNYNQLFLKYVASFCCNSVNLFFKLLLLEKLLNKKRCFKTFERLCSDAILQ